MYGHIMRCGTIGSCQSAATSETVSAAGHETDSCKWRYSKCPDLYLYTHYILSRHIRDMSTVWCIEYVYCCPAFRKRYATVADVGPRPSVVRPVSHISKAIQTHSYYGTLYRSWQLILMQHPILPQTPHHMFIRLPVRLDVRPQLLSTKLHRRHTVHGVHCQQETYQ